MNLERRKAAKATKQMIPKWGVMCAAVSMLVHVCLLLLRKNNHGLGSTPFEDVRTLGR